MKTDQRINVRADQPLKDELKEVIEKTGLSEAVIVREAVKEKLRSLKNTHPAYTSELDAAPATEEARNQLNFYENALIASQDNS